MHGTSYVRILALDLGKFNSVLCIFDLATAIHSFVSLPSDRQTVHDRLVEHATTDPKQTLVVFETCESSGWVHDVADAAGFSIAVANPSNEAWRCRHHIGESATGGRRSNNQLRDRRATVVNREAANDLGPPHG
jgi:hypothetical protein